MVREKLIEETLILAQKYNDFIKEKDLRFTEIDMAYLKSSLIKKRKDQVGTENKKILEMFNYLRSSID